MLHPALLARLILLWSVTVSQTFLVSHDLGSFEESWPGSLEEVTVELLGLSDVFS